MDVHIYMSYCTPSVFKHLALNHLGLCHHGLFQKIERLIEDVKVTPAEVAGELMRNKDTEASLQGLLNFLQNKMNEGDKVISNNIWVNKK